MKHCWRQLCTDPKTQNKEEKKAVAQKRIQARALAASSLMLSSYPAEWRWVEPLLTSVHSKA